VTVPLVECVPNFSEGRRADVLDALREAVTSVAGVHLLDVQADVDHNRSVFTFVGAPDAVAEAAFRAAKVARARIDLRSHKGAHPRMGATDVCPFIPVDGVTMAECVALARRHASSSFRPAPCRSPLLIWIRPSTRRSLARCKPSSSGTARPRRICSSASRGWPRK